MPKVIVTIDGMVVKEVPLTKEKTTLGRRPYNDVVIDNLAVSGEHAVFIVAPEGVYLEDLNSTNGTFINGAAVKKQKLNNDDVVDIGKYKIRFVGDDADGGFDKTMVFKPSAAPSSRPAPLTSSDAAVGQASIKVLNGAAAGREIPITKVVTTLGKPGVAVAAITRRQQGYVVHHVEGGGNPNLNGAPLTDAPLALKNGDVIELAGTQMQFIQA